MNLSISSVSILYSQSLITHWWSIYQYKAYSSHPTAHHGYRVTKMASTGKRYCQYCIGIMDYNFKHVDKKDIKARIVLLLRCSTRTYLIMKLSTLFAASLCALGVSAKPIHNAHAHQKGIVPGKHYDRIFIIYHENKDYEDVQADDYFPTIAENHNGELQSLDNGEYTHFLHNRCRVDQLFWCYSSFATQLCKYWRDQSRILAHLMYIFAGGLDLWFHWRYQPG